MGNEIADIYEGQKNQDITTTTQMMVCRYATYIPKKTSEAEKYIQQCWDCKYGNLIPTEKALAVQIAFYMPIPKSTPQKNICLMLLGKISHIKKTDLDNLIKTVLEALNKTAYKDDGQIFMLSVKKEYAETPKTVVWVQEVE